MLSDSNVLIKYLKIFLNIPKFQNFAFTIENTFTNFEEIFAAHKQQHTYFNSSAKINYYMNTYIEMLLVI